MKKSLTVKGKAFDAEKTLICLPVVKKTEEEILSEIKRLTELSADVIEWRVDAFEKAEDLNAIRSLLAKAEPLVKETPFLYTFRSKGQGGLLALDEDVIYDIHQIGAESAAVDMVDVEIFASKRPAREITALHELGAIVVGSHHDFEGTPSDSVIEMTLKQIRESGADIVKLALMPNDAKDVIALLAASADFHEQYPDTPLITMAMGKLGELSRVAGCLTGSCLTFGNAGEASAPGQIPYEKLREMLKEFSLS